MSDEEQSANPEAGEEQTYYLYVEIESEKTGENPTREIVPSETVKKFNYEEFKRNPKNYSLKKFKIRLTPESIKKACYVLHAEATYHEMVQEVAKRRFGPPNRKFIETITDESTVRNSSQEEETIESRVNSKKRKGVGSFKGVDTECVTEDEENDAQAARNSKENKFKLLSDSKKQRKTIAKKKGANKQRTEEKIINEYLHERSEDDEDDEEIMENEDNFSDDIHQTSTPLTHKQIVKQNKNAICSQNKTKKQLEYQLKEARNEAIKMSKLVRANNEGSDHVSRDDNVNNNSVSCYHSFDPFKMHDKIYHFNKEQLEKDLEHDDEGNVHLGDNVYCNPVAYNDSFKTKDPFKCLSLLSEGVYGLQDLSTRCVRKQKNTMHKKILSPKKKLVIERKVYAFMRIKDKTITQIDDFLNDLNIKHGKVIYGAIKRLEYEAKQKEIEKQVDAELNALSENTH